MNQAVWYSRERAPKIIDFSFMPTILDLYFLRFHVLYCLFFREIKPRRETRFTTFAAVHALHVSLCVCFLISCLDSVRWARRSRHATILLKLFLCSILNWLSTACIQIRHTVQSNWKRTQQDWIVSIRDLHSFASVRPQFSKFSSRILVIFSQLFKRDRSNTARTDRAD